MPSHCCVPGCHSNYAAHKSKENVKVFTFPDKNKTAYKKWLDVIPRACWEPSSRTVVCIKHFHDDDVIKEDIIKFPDGTVKRYERCRFKLRPDAVPAIFPNSSDCRTAAGGGKRKIHFKQSTEASGNKNKRKKKIKPLGKIKSEKMEYNPGNDKSLKNGKRDYRKNRSGHLHLSATRKKRTNASFKAYWERMKQQQEAGTSSSSLLTPADEYSTSSPICTAEYSTASPTPTEEFSVSSPNPIDEHCAGPSNVKPPYKMKESRKFVNVAFFVKSLQNLNNHGGDGCNFSDMHISGETKCGWNSGIQLSCNICLVTVTVWMDDPDDKPVAAQPPTPPTLAKTASVKVPLIAQKPPAKKRNTRYRKTPTPPPDPPVQQHFLVPRPVAESLVSSQTNVLHQDMAYNASKQVNQPFIKQEIIPTEDVPSSGKNRVPLSTAQPAAVQLLFYVEPSGSAPSLDTSVNDLIVPYSIPSEVLPMDLNLVKKEVEEESPPMEVVNNIPRLVPMSETSLDRSKTSFASEPLTKTGHFKDSSPVKVGHVMSSTKTYSKENRHKYFASLTDTSDAKTSTVSSCPTSIIPQRSFQQVISSSKTDAVNQTANGESDKIGLT